MNLSKFDGLPVRVKTKYGEVFEGCCTYNSADFNEHEFGDAQEGLSFPYLLLYKSDIQSVERLKQGFSAPFGALEELALQDGVIGIETVLFCEEDEHVLRMLRCLEHALDPANGLAFPFRQETLDMLRQLIDETNNETVKAEAKRLIAKMNT